MGIIAIIIGVVVGILLLRGTTGHPRVGDHWHAIYEISVGGELLAPFPVSNGAPGIHTHGDGLIHIHPDSADDEGKNANLARFLGTVGVTFNAELLRLPDGRQFTNGSIGADGQTSTLRLMVGRTPDFASPTAQCSGYTENKDFERYRPQHNDCVRIEFGVPGTPIAPAATAAPTAPAATPAAASPAPTPATPAPTPATPTATPTPTAATPTPATPTPTPASPSPTPSPRP